MDERMKRQVAGARSSRAVTAPALAAALAVAACSGSATPPADDCWQLRTVDRVRLVPRPGAAQAMVGGTIQGSNDSPTNGFVTLATLAVPPAEGQFTEVAVPGAAPYRYVKYYGPPGSYGQVAEVEFWSGGTRLEGEGFGTVGSRSGNPWGNALDGDPATFYDGAGPSDSYVGIDLAAGHVAAAPTFSPPPGSYPAPRAVSLSSATPGAAIRYSRDGSDPVAAGIPYGGPVVVVAGQTTLRAAAVASCMLASPVAIGLYEIGSEGATSQSSIHVGNSLTDAIDGWLQPIAAAGGIALDYSRYTVPGIGTWVYQEQPTGGFGVENVQVSLRTRPFDHVSFQPFKNGPCLPTGHAAEASAQDRSDAVNIEEAWNDASARNAAVQMWVYQAWPETPTHGFTGCITGGSYMRDPAIWNPAPPATWEDAVRNQVAYDEAVRAGLAAMHPERPPPYVIPTSLAFLALKRSVQAGTFPGLPAAESAFWSTFFSDGGADDHPTAEGRYFVALVFYAAMFQRDPAGLPHANTSLSDAQAAALQAIAWQTVTGYAWSGVAR
jgi:hypothetical protein